MEGKSFSNSLKDHSVVSMRTSKDNNRKLQDSCGSNSPCQGEDCLDGISWPPRSYPCTFCKREFRSAQALGGHMNVHRRDRAKLRQSPPRDGQFPILNLNTDPDPSRPSFSPPLACTIHSLVSPPLSALPSSNFSSPSEIKKWTLNAENPQSLSPKASDLTKTRTRKYLFDAKEYDGFADKQNALNISSKAAEIMRLELKIGLVSDPNEDLDLELRLGYP